MRIPALHRLKTCLGTLIIATLTSSGPVSAGPLGIITIDSYDKAAQATTILGTALVRIDNRFVVTPDAHRQLLLVHAGLSFETLIDDVDPEAVYQVMSLDHPQAVPVIDLAAFGRVIEFECGIRLMILSRAEAASISEAPGMCAVKLSDRDIPISFIPPSVSMPFADEYPSDSLAARVNQDSLYAYVQRLENFRTRFTYTDSCLAARDWIAQKFLDWGYVDATYQQFYFESWWPYNVGWCHSNVVAVKPGIAVPDELIVIGGHYDAVNVYEWPQLTLVDAPGADDNGSGVALTMEVARVLADVPLRKTIVFILFDAEEIAQAGSAFAAADFQNAGATLEVMYNFDMVANVEDTLWDLDLSSGPVSAYRDFSVATARRMSSLVPVVSALDDGSDHYQFHQNGYAVVDHRESDFSPNWHKGADVITEMNFPYFAEVAKTAVASLAYVAEAAYPVTAPRVSDVGDGHSLDVSWSECSPDCGYTVYWGANSGLYTDSLALPAGDCRVTVTGLPEGDSCHFLVIGEPPNGYRALYGTEAAGVPLLYPRVPQGFAGTPVSAQLRLNLWWRTNYEEADFSHYNVYRRIGLVGAWELYDGHVTDTTYTDTDVKGHVAYEYAVTSVDSDGHESALSNAVLLYPATFDGGLVIGDGFAKVRSYDPDQAEQEAWLDTVLGGMGFGVAYADDNGGPASLSDIGSYSMLLWIDDDLGEKNISLCEGALTEFAEHGENMLISGYRTWYYWSPRSVPSSHLLYREFGLSYYDYTTSFDFIGTFGQNGWPSVQIDPARGIDEWGYIPKLTPLPGAQVILTFDSYLNLPGWEGEPVGLAYETVHGKRVLLSFPLYYLTPASAEALLAKVMEYFGFSSEFAKGDLDHSGTIDIADVVVLLDHLFISLQPLEYPELADVDTRPGISIGDVFVLIYYLFLDGLAPEAIP